LSSRDIEKLVNTIEEIRARILNWEGIKDLDIKEPAEECLQELCDKLRNHF
jgi:hypothetical protein